MISYTGQTILNAVGTDTSTGTVAISSPPAAGPRKVRLRWTALPGKTYQVFEAGGVKIGDATSADTREIDVALSSAVAVEGWASGLEFPAHIL